MKGATDVLTVCSSCRRHIADDKCPFCDAPRRPLRAAAVAIALTACSSSLNEPEIAIYGGPPPPEVIEEPAEPAEPEDPLARPESESILQTHEDNAEVPIDPGAPQAEEEAQQEEAQQEEVVQPATSIYGGPPSP